MNAARREAQPARKSGRRSTVHNLFPQDGSTARGGEVVVQWRHKSWVVEHCIATGGRRRLFSTNWTKQALDAAVLFAESLDARAVFLEDVYK